MRVLTDRQSPNFSPQLIPVEFVVLHYTACSLERTFEIFSDPQRGVCAHFVLDTNGDLYDLGRFLEGPIRQGAHAGESYFNLDGKEYRAFNQFSIGIEIINLNGNLFPFTDAQYESLAESMKRLQTRFPALKDPARVVGHEQIAGHRGKCDPGLCFDWSRFFKMSYGAVLAPVRTAICSEKIRNEMLSMKLPATDDAMGWSKLSSELEARLRGESCS